MESDSGGSSDNESGTSGSSDNNGDSSDLYESDYTSRSCDSKFTIKTLKHSVSSFKSDFTSSGCSKRSRSEDTSQSKEEPPKKLYRKKRSTTESSWQSGDETSERSKDYPTTESTKYEDSYTESKPCSSEDKSHPEERRRRSWTRSKSKHVHRSEQTHRSKVCSQATPKKRKQHRKTQQTCKKRRHKFRRIKEKSRTSSEPSLKPIDTLPSTSSFNSSIFGQLFSVIKYATVKKRWLIVNIIDLTNPNSAIPSNFWTENEIVQVFRKTSCVLQVSCDSEEGVGLKERYSFKGRECIIIVDPYSLLKRAIWENFTSISEIYHEILMFIDTEALHIETYEGRDIPGRRVSIWPQSLPEYLLPGPSTESQSRKRKHAESESSSESTNEQTSEQTYSTRTSRKHKLQKTGESSSSESPNPVIEESESSQNMDSPIFSSTGFSPKSQAFYDFSEMESPKMIGKNIEFRESLGDSTTTDVARDIATFIQCVPLQDIPVIGEDPPYITDLKIIDTAELEKGESGMTEENPSAEQVLMESEETVPDIAMEQDLPPPDITLPNIDIEMSETKAKDKSMPKLEIAATKKHETHTVLPPLPRLTPNPDRLTVLKKAAIKLQITETGTNVSGTVVPQQPLPVLIPAPFKIPTESQTSGEVETHLTSQPSKKRKEHKPRSRRRHVEISFIFPWGATGCTRLYSDSTMGDLVYNLERSLSYSRYVILSQDIITLRMTNPNRNLSKLPMNMTLAEAGFGRHVDIIVDLFQCRDRIPL